MGHHRERGAGKLVAVSVQQMKARFGGLVCLGLGNPHQTINEKVLCLKVNTPEIGPAIRTDRTPVSLTAKMVLKLSPLLDTSLVPRKSPEIYHPRLERERTAKRLPTLRPASPAADMKHSSLYLLCWCRRTYIF